MSDCCDPQIRRGDDSTRKRVLVAVLAINAVMFVVEIAAGWVAHSVALQADSLDMLGDTLVYGFSLFVVGRGPIWRSRAAVLKGGTMLAFGAFVLVQTILKVFGGVAPEPLTVSVVGLVALCANASCVMLLFRHRSDDINMRSTWICSRNDIVANLAVIASAGLVAAMGSAWPDILVGTAIVFLFVRSATGVLRAAKRERGSTAPKVGRGINLCPAGLCPAHACKCL